MDSNDDLIRPAHQTGIKSCILWVEVPYAPSGTTGEASQSGLHRGHNAGMDHISPPFWGDSHFFSYPHHFHYLYIHFPIFTPNNITFPICPLVISRPTFHLTLLSFHWPNISLSPSLIPLFSVYQSPTGTFVLNSLFHLPPFLFSAIHSTSICVCTHTHTALYAHTHTQPCMYAHTHSPVPILFLQLLLPEHDPISLPWSLGCHMHLSSLHTPFLSTLMTEAVDPQSYQKIAKLQIYQYTPTKLRGVTHQTVIFSINAMWPSNRTDK